MIEGEQVGRIEIDNGWGKRWRLKDLTGYFCSREIAMAEAPALLAQGKLVTRSVLDERHRRREAERTRRREEDRQARQEAAAATLEALRARVGDALSNTESDAIVTAVTGLRGDQ